ncbi:MAG: hypothetical protein KGN78_05695 [Actinomycetales bacterium]|nr:hypothetical protein [Actinomycetales bacterium]
MGYEITDTFSEPFWQAPPVLPSYFSPSVVGVAGVPYLLDTESGQFRRESFDVVQQRNTNDARDVLLLPQDVWRQQTQSWHLGAGQSNLDRDDTLIYRFDESYGVDPWTEWRLSLLPTTSRLAATATLNGDTKLLNVRANSTDYLIVVNGQKAYWYSALSTTTAPVGSVTMSAGSAIIDATTDGNHVIAAVGDQFIWYVNGPSATPVKWANHKYVDLTMVEWEKDYLIAADGNVLYNALKANNPNPIYTHPDTDFRWYSAASGSSAIYVLGRQQSKTYIHRIGVKTDGTGLTTAVVAAELPDDEVGYEIESYLNFILIGTSKGVRVAQADSNGDLTLGSIIPASQPVRCFEGQDRFVWFGNSAVDGFYSTGTDNDIFPSGTVCGLGRLDLSRTTVNQLTPAYATDIVADTVTGQQVQSVATFTGKRVFSIGNGDVWFETDTLMEGGWLKQGVISFSIEDLKTALYTQLKWEPLKGEVDIDVSFDSAAYQRLAAFTIEGSIRSGNISLNGVQFSRLEPRIVLKRSSTDAEAGPSLTRLEVRAIPVKGRNCRWTLPIMNYEDLEIDSVPYKRNPLEVVNTLIGLVESGQLFSLQESGQSYVVHGKDYMWQPEKLTENGLAWQGVFTLVVEEVS